MKVLTEDNIEVFPYPLLTKYSKCIIKGSKSNTNIVSYMLKEMKNNTLVYVDTLPDNVHSVEAYRSAVISSRSLSNVYVIPIPCIEYYFTKAFISRDSEERSAVLNFGEFKNIKYNTFHRKLHTSRTFEKFCKSFIEKEMNCFSDGTFINVDCKCDNKLGTCIDFNVYAKYIRFIQELPLRSVFITENIPLEDIIKAQEAGRALYYKCARHFKKYGYISDIYII